jgi:hypothetical protein
MVRAHTREEERSAKRRRRKAVAAVAATSAAAAIGASGADAATFNVTNLDDTGAGSLRNAITQANADPAADTITFQSGLSGTIPVNGEMTISEDLTIQGPGASTITLDGGGNDRIIEATSQKDVSISGLTFTHGSVGTGADGGALYFSGGSASLDDVVVTNSDARRGGGVFFNGNDFSIADSRLSGNSADYIGGGIGGDGYNGVSPDESISITGTTVSGNSARYAGGGIALYDSYVDVLVDSSTISSNTISGAASSSYENGGGIWFEDTYDGASTTVSNSTVTGNTAPDAGGGVSFGENFYGPTGVFNSTIANNTAGGSGGGIQFADIENVNFSLVDSTVTGNSAPAGGGVLRGYDVSSGSSSDSPLDVKSSVVAGNKGGDDPDFTVNTSASGDLTLGNSLIGTAAGVNYTASPAGSNIVTPEPGLGPLGDNGGPTETMLPTPSSPLVDAGLANGLSKDQRGFARTVDYPGVPSTHGSDGTDIGAGELRVNEVDGAFVDAASPQKQGKKKVKVKVTGGADEQVKFEAFGVITIGKGNAVLKATVDQVNAGDRSTLTVQPKKKKSQKRILKALGKGRKVTANLTGKLIDQTGNVYEQDLTAKLKGKVKKK